MSRIRRGFVALAVVSLASTAMPGPATAKDLIDTLVASGGFCTFLGAIRAADMENMLRGPGPYTVFAPSDVAFSRLSESERSVLLGEGFPSEMAALVGRHVVAERLTSDRLAGKRLRVETVSGDYILLDGTMGRPMIGEYNDILTADIPADNGVIHVPRSIIPGVEPTS